MVVAIRTHTTMRKKWRMMIDGGSKVKRSVRQKAASAAFIRQIRHSFFLSGVLGRGYLFLSGLSFPHLAEVSPCPGLNASGMGRKEGFVHFLGMGICPLEALVSLI